MKIGATTTITIAGAGLAGSLLSVLLAQRGFRVRLVERNRDPRRGEAPSGRSINLAIGERGRHALRLAGVLEHVDRFTIPMRGRMLHDERGELKLQPYGAIAGEVIWSAHRALLNCALLDAAEATGRVELAFGRALDDVEWGERRLCFRDGSVEPFDVLLGADGAGSTVRRAMQATTELGVTESLLDHGYRELTFPPAADGGFAMDPHALHIWPRGGFMMIALPNGDHSFTGTLFLARNGDPSFATLSEPASQRAFFAAQFADALPLLTRLERDFREHPLGLLGTIRCRRWGLGGRAVLIGDAAHAIVPFHGQGMNAALEDCVALARLTEDRERSWREVFERYEQARRAHADALADMALENYTVMRESVRDPGFHRRKALEHELERRFGERFIGRYSLVMFHRVPYGECYRRGEIQSRILDRLLQGVTSLDEVDYDAAAKLIRDRLEPVTEPE